MAAQAIHFHLNDQQGQAHEYTVHPIGALDAARLFKLVQEAQREGAAPEIFEKAVAQVLATCERDGRPLKAKAELDAAFAGNAGEMIEAMGLVFKARFERVSPAAGGVPLERPAGD